MRIFIILSRIPYPLEKGDKLRAFNQIKYLSKNNEIILFALNDLEVNKEEAFQFLQPYCRSVNFFDLSLRSRIINLIKALINGNPFQQGYFYSKQANKEIKKLIKEYEPDHLYCQLARVAEYVKNISLPKTLDYQDAFSKGLQRRIRYSSFFQRIFLKLEFKRMLNYEFKVFSYFNNKLIISGSDRAEIPHPEKEEIKIISNGVDFSYYSPKPSTKDIDLIFSGNMSYPPNVIGARYLIKTILPILKTNGLKVKIVIAGAFPTEEVKSLANENIIVTGWVDDLRDYYIRAKVFVAPMLIGTGLQNKLLEAMSMEIPCITSPLVNSALKATNKAEILIAQTAKEYAQHIEFLLKNTEKANEIGKKGRTFVQQKFCWEKTGSKLEQILKQT